MMRFMCNFLLLTAFLAVVLVVLSLNGWHLRKPEFISMQIGQMSLRVETAKTPLQIEKGLGGRAELGSDGMLFYMPSVTMPLFWMKGMQFGLDFIWIRNGKVVDLTQQVPPPKSGESDANLPTYSPKEEVSHVLEVPAGFIQQHAIKIDDAVVLP